MVRGLDIFKSYFKEYADNYVIIGGTACDMIIDQAGLVPRATKDIDIILVVEALTGEFVKRFWEFVEKGYEIIEKGSLERKYYRFTKPLNDEYPYQIEIFSRNPDLLDLKEGTHLTPIPVLEGIPSLSAILLDDEYYAYTINHSKDDEGLRIANIEALICLKAKAFLDMVKRRASGEDISEREIRKHKGDIFRLGVTLTESDLFELPESIKADLQAFVEVASSDLPDKAIFKEMELVNIQTENVLNQILKSFQLNGE